MKVGEEEVRALSTRVNEMIVYILGPSNSGKSRYLHDMIGKRLSSSKQLLIVPEQYTLQAEIELIKDLSLDGIIDVDIMSFNRFCTRVLSETGGIEETEINDLGRAMVLRSILDKCSEELLVFSSVSKKTGFVEKMSTLIREMKHVGIDSAHLKQQLEHHGSENLTHRKLNDIMTIMSYYEQFMAKGYFDEEDKLLAVIDKIKHTHLLNDTVIYFDGFDSFSEQEYTLIKEMLFNAKGAVIALSIEQKEVYAPVSKTLKKLRKIAEDMNIEERLKPIDIHENNSELMHLKNYFFSYPYEIYESPMENISVHMNNNLYDEIDGVARDIVDKIKSGYRYNELAVVTGHLEGYTSIIKRVFNEYDISYFIDDKVSIMNHPIVRYVLASLSCLNSGFKREDVLKVMKSGLSDIEHQEAAIFENYIVSRGLRGKKWFEPIEDDALEKLRQKVIEPLMNFEKVFPVNGSVAEMTKHLFDYLIETQVPEKIEVWIEFLQGEEALDKVQESTQVWHKIIEIFEQLIELEGADKKTIKEYLRILEAGFAEVQLGIIPPSVDQVAINTIERSKSKTIKGLYVIGMNDGVLPKKYSDEGLLLDDEKVKLKEMGIDLETDSSSIMERDYFSTLTALSKATAFIRFSYALSDTEGKALRPSIYIDKLQRIFKDLMVQSHVLDIKDPLTAYTPENHYKSLTEYLRIYADDYMIDERWFSVLAYYHSKASWTHKVSALGDAVFYDNQVMSIPKEQARQLYNLPLLSSVSRLERYRRCPFSHYVHYGLRPKERKTYDIKLPDIGLLFHKSLEAFDEKMKSDNEDWMTITKNRTHEIIDQVVDELVMDYNHHIFKSSHRFSYLIKKLKRVGKRAAWTLVTQVKQGAFIPYAHEIGFGYDGVLPIVIELSNGERMLLKGWIDRVDKYTLNEKEYIKIIDYKSGSKKFSLSEVYQGLQLQLMVYLDAILENHDYFKVKELLPAGVFYFKIDDPMLESELLQGEKTEEALLKALKVDGLMIDDIEIAKAMDQDILDNRKSSVIPFELKKDDTVSSRSKVVNLNEFYNLIGHVKTILKELGDEITEGQTTIGPVKLGTMIGCQSCDYQSICQFDQSFGNRYDILKNYKSEDVLEKLKEETEHAKLDI